MQGGGGVGGDLHLPEVLCSQREGQREGGHLVFPPAVWGRPGRAPFLPPSPAFLPMGATGTEGIWDSEKGEGRG